MKKVIMRRYNNMGQCENCNKYTDIRKAQMHFCETCGCLLCCVCFLKSDYCKGCKK